MSGKSRLGTRLGVHIYSNAFYRLPTSDDNHELLLEKKYSLSVGPPCFSVWTLICLAVHTIPAENNNHNNKNNNNENKETDMQNTDDQYTEQNKSYPALNNLN